MMISLAVFPLLALSASVSIDDVSAGAAANKVTIAVTTSLPVAATDVRSKLAEGKLQLYLDGGQVRRDRRSFKSGGLAANVLKREDYAKVEVPLAAELGCAGPITIDTIESGFRATIACKGASVSGESEAVEEKPAAVAGTTRQAAKPAPEKMTAQKAEYIAEKTAEPAPPAAAPAVAVEAKPVAAAGPIKAEPIKAAPATTAAPAPASSNAMMVPAMALIAIGAAAYFLKKRQQTRSSMIQILETAQLGPKRQLVVARINGETLILGSSEAGITCLSGMHKLPPMASEWGMSPTQMNQLSQMQMGHLSQMNQMSQMSQMAQMQMGQPKQQFQAFDPPPATTQAAPAQETMDEGGILTRLFRARGQEKPVEKFDNIELHEFDNLLQESVADQELRRKLSSGLRGKVS